MSVADAQLAIYPQAGHAPHQQHPDSVAAQVTSFLDSIRPRRWPVRS